MIRNGHFGDRLLHIARFHFDDVHSFDLPFGHSLTKEHEIDLFTLAKKTAASVLLGVHFETSACVFNDISIIGKVAKSLNAICLIDGISSLGAVECSLSDWGIDCFVSSCYKCLMCPGGLSFMLVNDRFIQAAKRKWSLYFNMEKILNENLNNKYLWSPSILSLLCLKDVVKQILSEGQDSYFRAIKDKAERFRNIIKDKGLEIYGSADYLSPCFTALTVEKNNAGEWLSYLKNEFGIIIGKGMGTQTESLLRIGHYPFRTYEDLEYLAEGIVDAFNNVGK